MVVSPVVVVMVVEAAARDERHGDGQHDKPDCSLHEITSRRWECTN
jgi:hypothetical protein